MPSAMPKLVCRPKVVKAPTSLISEEEASASLSCATNCGYIASAVGAAVTGAAVYKNFKLDDHASTAPLPANEAAGKIGLASLGTAGAMFLCAAACGAGSQPLRHHAPNEPFVLEGTYVHEASSEEAKDAFTAHIKAEGMPPEDMAP